LSYKSGVCTVCGRDRRIASKGLCGACYSRLQKNGTTEYIRKGTFTLCTLEGCNNRAVSHGLCQKHSQRLRKHGHIDSTRPESWGQINKHPLLYQWNQIHSRKTIKCAPEWQTDFLRFIADVGDRPSEKHRLVRPDRSRPIGPDNFRWEVPLVTRELGESDQDYQARSSRIHRAVKPEAYKRRELRRRFAGLTPEEVQRISEFQDRRCAICGEYETSVLWERVLSLAVDHEHRPGGKVRGLLCLKCNRALGLFKDNAVNLLNAIAYLQDCPTDQLARGRNIWAPTPLRVLDTRLQPGTATDELDKDAILPQT
jgi:hypothetical protein